MRTVKDFFESTQAQEESCQKHGAFVSIHKKGVLIRGASGVGKSETALELVDRGHHFIADDMVVIERIKDSLEGKSSKLAYALMKIRGLGVLDLREIYGAERVINSHKLDLIITLKSWEQSSFCDRLEMPQEQEIFLGLSIPTYTLSVNSTRHLALLIELIVSQHSLRELGRSPAKEFKRRLDDARSPSKQEAC